MSTRLRGASDGDLAFRVKGALAPLLGDAPLSRSAVSRVMRILREQCEAWRTRLLADRGIIYLFLDAIHVRVRVDRRVQVVPVLVALGVTATGEKELVALQLVTSESTAAWTSARSLIVLVNTRATPLDQSRTALPRRGSSSTVSPPASARSRWTRAVATRS